MHGHIDSMAKYMRSLAVHTPYFKIKSYNKEFNTFVIVPERQSPEGAEAIKYIKKEYGTYYFNRFGELELKIMKQLISSGKRDLFYPRTLFNGECVFDEIPLGGQILLVDSLINVPVDLYFDMLIHHFQFLKKEVRVRFTLEKLLMGVPTLSISEIEFDIDPIKLYENIHGQQILHTMLLLTYPLTTGALHVSLSWCKWRAKELSAVHEELCAAVLAKNEIFTT